MLGVNYVIDKDNYCRLLEFLKLLKNIGVAQAKVMGMLVGDNGEECNNYHNNFKDVVKEQLDDARALEDKNFKIIDHYHEFPERYNKEYSTCPSMQFLTIIGADSKVYSCHDKPYTARGLLDSIESRSFKDFWYSSENEERLQEINPSLHCNHRCAEDKRNLLLHEYLSADSNHIEFV